MTEDQDRRAAAAYAKCDLVANVALHNQAFYGSDTVDATTEMGIPDLMVIYEEVGAPYSEGDKDLFKWKKGFWEWINENKDRWHAMNEDAE